MDYVITYIVYTSLLLLSVYLTSYKIKYIDFGGEYTYSNKIFINQFIALLFISLIAGLRYDVGNDWFGYKRDYETIVEGIDSYVVEQYMEKGFLWVNKLASLLGLSFYWLLFILSLVTWYLLFKSVENNILPLFIFFLFVDEYFFWGMSAVRQFLSISIWLFSIQYIFNRDLFKFLLMISIALLFHSSALILFLFYFIPYEKIANKYIWLFIFIVTFFIGNSDGFMNQIISLSSILTDKISILNVYTRYLDDNRLTVNAEEKTGAGYLFKIIVNVGIIILSSNVINANRKLSIYFILFFLGSILFNISFNVELLARINDYFLIIRSVVLSFLIWHYWKIPKYRFFIFIFILLYIILFLYSISKSSNKCAPYQFFFWVEN